MRRVWMWWWGVGVVLLTVRLAGATDCSSFPNFCDPSATCTTLSPSGLEQCEPCYCPWDTDSYIPNMARLNDFLTWNKTWGVPISLADIVAGDDDYEVLIAPVALTLTSVACRCDLNCGTPATLSFKARKSSPAGIALSGGGDLTCGTGTGAVSFINFDTGDADRLLAAGEGLQISVTNSPTAGQRISIIPRLTIP